MKKIVCFSLICLVFLAICGQPIAVAQRAIPLNIMCFLDGRPASAVVTIAQIDSRGEIAAKSQKRVYAEEGQAKFQVNQGQPYQISAKTYTTPPAYSEITINVKGGISVTVSLELKRQ